MKKRHVQSLSRLLKNGQGRQTNITPRDHERLKQMLLKDPTLIFALYKECQVESLDQMSIYNDLKRDRPEKAETLCLIAELCGIPEKMNDTKKQKLGRDGSSGVDGTVGGLPSYAGAVALRFGTGTDSVAEIPLPPGEPEEAAQAEDRAGESGAEQIGHSLCR